MAKNILIVDDDYNTCDVFSSILVSAGYQTDKAYDGEEALAKLDINHYDLVISDIFMPKLDGIELLKKIKDALMSEKVILITGMGTNQLRDTSLRNGAVTFLEKPIEARDLLEAVSSCFTQVGFDGNVSQINLFDLIQFLALAKKTKILDVKFGEHHGQIYINRGEIVHAVTKTQSGEMAFHECLSWTSGSFKDLDYREPKRISIRKPLEHLLMDAAKMVDESNQQKQSVDSNTKSKSNTETRLKPFLLKFLRIEGVSGVAWLDKNGSFLLGEGSDQGLLKSIPKFIFDTESQLKSFHPFPRLDRFCLHSKEGQRIFTMRLKQLSLTIILEVGYEAGPIVDMIARQLNIKHNSDAL